MMRKRIYIAGAISKGDLEDNIRQATEAFAALMKAGYAPLCPHLSCYLDGPVDRPSPVILTEGTTAEQWYEVGVAWASAADAILRLPGESVGTDKECTAAELRGLPVFKSIKALRKGFQP